MGRVNDMRTISVKAPAKINLTLDVLGKRTDGYHDVEMVMTTVDLSDRLELTVLDTDEIRIQSEHAYVPSDHRNLAYRAADLLRKRFGITEGVETSSINTFRWRPDWLEVRVTRRPRSAG